MRNQNRPGIKRIHTYYMQSRGWTVSVDRGNRWRDREMTPITLKIICMREGERGGQRERTVGERILKAGNRSAENNGLRKTRIGTRRSLENHSLVGSVQLEKKDPLKTGLRVSLLMFDIHKEKLLFVHRVVTQRVKRYSLTSTLPSPINIYSIN